MEGGSHEGDRGSRRCRLNKAAWIENENMEYTTIWSASLGNAKLRLILSSRFVPDRHEMQSSPWVHPGTTIQQHYTAPTSPVLMYGKAFIAVRRDRSCLLALRLDQQSSCLVSYGQPYLVWLCAAGPIPIYVPCPMLMLQCDDFPACQPVAPLRLVSSVLTSKPSVWDRSMPVYEQQTSDNSEGPRRTRVPDGAHACCSLQRCSAMHAGPSVS